MLVLTRKIGESIECSGPCQVTIVSSEPGRVRVGLVGPKETEFVRSELTVPGEKNHDGRN